jgi:ribosome biogenesis GTPase A
MTNNEEKGYCAKATISWYPGHMAKTKRLINEQEKIIDIVYEIVDARIPLSSKIKDNNSVLVNKPHILIMSKYDLCDKKETLKWQKYYEAKNYHVVCLDLDKSNVDFSGVINITNDIMKKRNLKRNDKGMKDKEVHAVVMGIPNVGKSTFINRFVGKTVVSVGNKPGVTTKLNWLNTKSNILLLDTPGILWPKLDNEELSFNLASFSAIKEEILPIDHIAWHILNKLNNYYPEILMERYKITKLSGDYDNDYQAIGQKMGCLLRGGEIDYKRVSTNIINDVKNARIKGITFDRMDK